MTQSTEPNADFGPLEALLQNPMIYDILINGVDSVYIWERDRGRVAADIRFENEAQLRQIAVYCAQQAGLTLDAASPIAEGRLPDGSRLLAIIPPVSHHTTLHLGRPIPDPLTLERLIELNAISPAAAEFIHACVQARANIGVFGANQSGKTTVLNVIAGMIPDEARVIVAQENNDTHLPHRNQVILEARPADLNGQGAVPMRQIVELALRLLPERIVVNELRGAEVLPVLDAMNVNYNVIFLVVASSPRELLARMELMAIAANPSLPVRAIREQIASGVHMLVQAQLLDDGFRRVVAVTEVVGMQGDAIQLADVFRFVKTGETENGRFLGSVQPTGHVPERLLALMQARGVTIDRSLFTVQ
jgi:pilus assembly protein CpaF